MCSPGGLYGDKAPSKIHRFEIYMDKLRNRVFVNLNNVVVSANSALDCAHAFQSALKFVSFSDVCALAMSDKCARSASNVRDSQSSFIKLNETDVSAHCRPLWRAARVISGLEDGVVARAWSSIVPDATALLCLRDDGSLDVDACSKLPFDIRWSFLSAITAVNEEQLEKVVASSGSERAYTTLDTCAAELRQLSCPRFLSARILSRIDTSSIVFKVAALILCVVALILIVSIAGAFWGEKNNNREHEKTLPSSTTATMAAAHRMNLFGHA